VQEYVREHKTALDLFRLRGPFGVTEKTGHELRLSTREHVEADLYLASAAEKAPLVILVHGYDSTKEAHAYQAAHLASWGMHAIAVQLPKRGPWNTNGRTVERIVRLIARSSAVVDPRVDATKIILVGHSFGATAVAVALASGAPAAGGILLDPAAIGRDLPQYLRRIAKPVLVLGADDELAPTRNRDYFYEYVRHDIAELSIRDATHEDAQFPSQTAVENHGIDPDVTEEAQLTFTAAMTAAALSLASTNSFDQAWTTYRAEFDKGRFFNAKTK